MAQDPRISGFDADDVRAGLRLAMTVGLPPVEADQPIFYMPATVTATGPSDQEGVPFSPLDSRTVSPPVTVQVPCAVEYHDGEGKLENFGVIVPARVVLTLLDEDYQQVKGFEFVGIGGIRYYYRRTENPKGLVSLAVYRVHCVSEDQL
jgi:hypothetical protein